MHKRTIRSGGFWCGNYPNVRAPNHKIEIQRLPARFLWSFRASSWSLFRLTIQNSRIQCVLLTPSMTVCVNQFWNWSVTIWISDDTDNGPDQGSDVLSTMQSLFDQSRKLRELHLNHVEGINDEEFNAYFQRRNISIAFHKKNWKKLNQPKIIFVLFTDSMPRINSILSKKLKS